ncbi:MAG: alpha/beta hydrolase [Bacteriovorax sp.]|nr:alpha/beta hydrolase [Bacteriovorax sp.]
MSTLKQSFRLQWKIIASEQGVQLLVCGDGPLLILIPGMEGSGESCIELAEWLIEESVRSGIGLQIILVDYKKEVSNSLDALTTLLEKILQQHLKGPVIIWSQSFGNVIATRILSRKNIKINKHLLMSPFVKIPKIKLFFGMIIMRWTPRAWYRRFTPGISRWFFGPMPKVHPFLDVLACEDPKNYCRRISWLFNISLSEQFSYSTFPRAVWIGKDDKLINPIAQINFFKTNQGDAAMEIKVLKNTGHMLFPEIIGKEYCLQLLTWLQA